MIMEQIYHLYITHKCGHNCPLCCNRLYDIDKLPVITVEDLKQAHTVCLTGGDPFYLLREELISIVDRLRIHYKNIQKIYIYTSGKMLWIEGAYSHWHELLQSVSGINIAPKDYGDWDRLDYLLQQPKWLEMTAQPGISNRLYIFDDQWDTWNTISKDVTLPATWQVIGRKWDKEFKTPENEHFVRLPILY